MYDPKNRPTDTLFKIPGCPASPAYSSPNVWTCDYDLYKILKNEEYWLDLYGLEL